MDLSDFLRKRSQDGRGDLSSAYCISVAEITRGICADPLVSIEIDYAGTIRRVIVPKSRWIDAYDDIVKAVVEVTCGESLIVEHYDAAEDVYKVTTKSEIANISPDDISCQRFRGW
jgi:hypothetical protein